MACERGIAAALLAVVSAGLLLPESANAQDNPFSSCRLEQSVRTLGSRAVPIPERPGARRWTLSGGVVITCDDTSLWADEVVYDDDTGEMRASGNVVFQQRDLSLYAERAEMNGRTKLGTFFLAHGSARIDSTQVERSQFGALEPDVLFYGEEVSKTGPATYTLKNGGFTTCVQPTPRWAISGSGGTITLDKHAMLRNVVLSVKGVPLLYLPAIYYPIGKDDRATGFLLPTYGSSLVRGTSLSNAFFLALGRSQDATFYHDWFTKSGHGLGAEYRYAAAPGSEGRANVYLLDERDVLGPDGTLVDAAHRSYRIDGDANLQLPRGFRLFGRVNYFDDVSTQQSYQNIRDLSARERYVSVSLTGALGRVRLAASGEQRDLFSGFEAAGQRYGRAPSIRLSAAEAPLGRSRVYVGASGEAAYLIRQNDISRKETDQSLWRFDGAPSIRLPVSSLPYLSATASASWRVTRWLESLDPVSGLQVPVALTRQLLDMRMQVVGPILARVFQTPGNGYAERFKHLIEPAVTFQRSTPFDRFARVVKNDGVDTQVGGVTTINYRLTNRLLARRTGQPATATSPAVPGPVRDVLSVDIAQTYYSDALAANYDSQYQSRSSASAPPDTYFSPLQITAVARPADSGSAQFRMEIDSKFRAVRTLGASGTLSSRQAELTAGWSKRRVIPGLPGFDNPARATHYVNASTTVRSRDNRAGGTYDFNYDLRQHSFLQQRIVAYYNSQCCGIAVDWQSVGASPRFPSDKRFGISFTLAGIGSFSNPLGSFGGR